MDAKANRCLDRVTIQDRFLIQIFTRSQRFKTVPILRTFVRDRGLHLKDLGRLLSGFGRVHLPLGFCDFLLISTEASLQMIKDDFGTHYAIYL